MGSWYDKGNSCFDHICGYTGMSFLIFTHSLLSITLNTIKARFALSSSPVFSRMDTVTDSKRFYNTVQELLELAEEKEEIDNLLTWWNQCTWFHFINQFPDPDPDLLNVLYSQIFPTYSSANPPIDKDSPLATIRQK